MDDPFRPPLPVGMQSTSRGHAHIRRRGSIFGFSYELALEVTDLATAAEMELAGSPLGPRGGQQRSISAAPATPPPGGDGVLAWESEGGAPQRTAT